MSTKERRRPSRTQTDQQPVRRRTAPRAKPRKNDGVVYTEARTFNKSRFVLQLVTVVAIVLALFMGMSMFFVVGYVYVNSVATQVYGPDNIEVTGTAKYQPHDVFVASGIQKGDSLLSLNKAQISGKIIAALPYVKSVRIGIKLPNTVNIEIEELPVVYAFGDGYGGWWLVSSGGRVVDSITAAELDDYTVIKGVELSGPQIGKEAIAIEPTPDTTDESGELIPPAVTGAQRLEQALKILCLLEDNGILGDAASVNVLDLSNMEVWYGARYQITLGDTTDLERKMTMAKAAIDQMGEHESGILDVSFMIRADQVVYTPFN